MEGGKIIFKFAVMLYAFNRIFQGDEVVGLLTFIALEVLFTEALLIDIKNHLTSSKK